MAPAVLEPMAPKAMTIAAANAAFLMQWIISFSFGDLLSSDDLWPASPTAYCFRSAVT
jgi:hypothetical protein